MPAYTTQKPKPLDLCHLALSIIPAPPMRVTENGDGALELGAEPRPGLGDFRRGMVSVGTGQDWLRWAPR